MNQNKYGRNGMQAIETRYKGYRFRSRLEARWAVYFDVLGIEWVYEPEGYKLAEGVLYLPDFWLPQVRMFAEVKPTWPDDQEIEKIKLLCDQSGHSVLILDGVPQNCNYFFLEKSQGAIGWMDCYIDTSYIYGHKEGRFYCCTGSDSIGPNRIRDCGMWSDTQIAVDAARSERFDTGHVWCRLV